MNEETKNPETQPTDKPAIEFSGMLADGGGNQAVNSNSSTEEKIQKSEALLDFIRRRMEESKQEIELERTVIPLKNKLRGKYFAFKEVADFIRNSGIQKELDEVSNELHFAGYSTLGSRIKKILSVFPAIQKEKHGK